MTPYEADSARKANVLHALRYLREPAPLETPGWQCLRDVPPPVAEAITEESPFPANEEGYECDHCGEIGGRPVIVDDSDESTGYHSLELRCSLCS